MGLPFGSDPPQGRGPRPAPQHCEATGVGGDQQGPGNHRWCGEWQRQQAPAQFAAAWATGDTGSDDWQTGLFTMPIPSLNITNL